MPRKKQIRKEEIKDFEIVFDDNSVEKFKEFLKEKLNSSQSVNDLVLELGCGYGEYSIALGAKFPNKFFIGMDVKADRLWRAAVDASHHKIQNIAFINSHILNLLKYLNEHSVSEIWLTFPDPQAKDRNEKHRLTHPRFLEVYKKLLKPEGFVHLKTDSDLLFDYSVELLEGLPDLEIKAKYYDIDQEAPDDEVLCIQTRYEKKHRNLGEKIKYLQFSFD